MTEQAVILAAGRGTRMQGAPSQPGLTPAQREAATRGLKALIPINGRPFLDYVLSTLVDAGIRRVCIVIGPASLVIRTHYAPERKTSTDDADDSDYSSSNRVHPRNPRNPWIVPRGNLQIQFAEQPEPRGTADALLRAEPFAVGESVIVVNADNLYPRSALEALRRLPRAGLIGFRRSALLRSSNFPAERVRDFALLEVNSQGGLIRIVEKPSPAGAAGFGPDPLVSMNVWLMPPSIFAAARSIRPSPRGELELQDAVRTTIEAGEQFRVIESHEGVLDLSRPEDIPTVEARLRNVEVRL